MEGTIEYRYEFANGEVKEFSITQTNGLDTGELVKWVSILNDLDRQEYNNEKREHRRHLSLDAYDRDDNLLPSDRDGFEEYQEALLWSVLREELTEKEAIAFDLFHRKAFTVSEIKEILDVNTPRVYALISAARKKLKKIIATI